MEILGLVWAASIFNQSSPWANTANLEGHRAQHQPPNPIGELASWLTSLAQAYGWSAGNVGPIAAYSTYTPVMSWLLPNLSNLDFSPVDTEFTGDPFISLAPVISQGMAGFDSPMADASTVKSVDSPIGESGESVASGEPAEPPQALGQWHHWDEIAIVRVVEPETAPTPELTPENAVSEAAELNNACMATTPIDYQASPIAITASPKRQLWVYDHFIGEVAGQVSAQRLADKLRQLLKEERLEPEHLQPVFGENLVGVRHRDEILFVVDEAMRSHPELPASAIALQWINNLRTAFDTEPLSLAQVQLAMAGFTETGQDLYGTASWYGPGFHGRKTANGERFNQNALTAAHKTLPFNTYLKVTNRLNGKSAIVRINDRGPYIGNRTLDLSKAAAHCLGSTGVGVIPYEATILDPVSKPELDELITAKLVQE